MTSLEISTLSNEEKKYTLLEALALVAPLIQQVVPLDCNIGVADMEKFLVDCPGKDLNLGNSSGKPLPKQGTLYKAIHTGELVSSIVPKEAYGILFKASSVPVKDESGNIIGGLALGISLKNQEILLEAVESFSSTHEEVVAATEELAASSQELASRTEELNLLQSSLIKEVEKTEEMLNIIKKVAVNSNMLGINASIEAARVGEVGRGFLVVAAEIRKMAENSSMSVEEIKEIIETVKQNVSEISSEIKSILEVTKHQEGAIQEVASSFQGLTNYIKNIEEIARKI